LGCDTTNIGRGLVICGLVIWFYKWFVLYAQHIYIILCHCCPSPTIKKTYKLM
jgi:hypothetical protein